MTHFVTLSFDDGFLKSFGETARIHEEFGLKACLNVFTESCKRTFKPPDSGHNAPTADWAFWNDLAERGHEIMPHGFDHSNHREIAWDDSKNRMDMCFEAFVDNMKGFDPRMSVFNFPYNASTPRIEEYLFSVIGVRALRTGGGGINPMPSVKVRRLTTTGMGPGNCEEHLDHEIAAFLKRDGGWLVYNLHGLDEEGWGPIGSDYLKRLLARLTKIDGLEVIPAAVAMEKYG